MLFQKRKQFQIFSAAFVLLFHGISLLSSLRPSQQKDEWQPSGGYSKFKINVKGISSGKNPISVQLWIPNGFKQYIHKTDRGSRYMFESGCRYFLCDIFKSIDNHFEELRCEHKELKRHKHLKHDTVSQDNIQESEAYRNFCKAVKKAGGFPANLKIPDIQLLNGRDINRFSIFDPCNGTYHNITEKNKLVSGCSIRIDGYGYIESCGCFPNGKTCSACRFLSPRCADRNYKSHFEINLDIIPEGHFTDNHSDDESLNEKPQKSNIFSLRNALLLFALVGGFATGIYKMKKKHNAPPANN